MVKEAIINDELDKLMMGANGYRITNPLVEEPVDSATLFGHHFNLYVKESGDKDFDEKLLAAMQKLLQTPEGLWWTLRLVTTYLFYYDADALLFRMDMHRLVPAINASIKKYGTFLFNNRNYVGYRFETGLCEPASKDINRINQKLIAQEGEQIAALHCS